MCRTIVEVDKAGTVKIILPGFTATGRLESIIAKRAKTENISEEQAANNMKAMVPMRRFAEALEITHVAAFLASPAASYVNGINIPVDRGRTKSL